MVSKSTKKSKSAPRVLGLTLSSVDIDLSVQSDEKDLNAEFDYEIYIDSPQILDNDVLVFVCGITVTKKYNDEELPAGISVKYFCGVANNSGKNEKENISLAKQYAGTTIWSSFVSLFAILTQQIGVSFPIMPPQPVEIDFRPDVEE
jgi:hypothetical protein